MTMRFHPVPLRSLLLLAASGGLLAACSGTVDLTQYGIGGDAKPRQPSASYSSAKAPSVVAQCIVERWKVASIAGSKPTPSMRAEGNALRLELRQDALLDQVLLISPQGAGSTTQRWTQGHYFGEKPPHIVAVEACQQ